MIFHILLCVFLTKENRTSRSFEFSNDLGELIVFQSSQILLIGDINVTNCEVLHSILIRCNELHETFNSRDRFCAGTTDENLIVV